MASALSSPVFSSCALRRTAQVLHPSRYHTQPRRPASAGDGHQPNDVDHRARRSWFTAAPEDGSRRTADCQVAPTALPWACAGSGLVRE